MPASGRSPRPHKPLRPETRPDKAEFAHALYACLNTSGLAQEEVAERTQISVSTLSGYLRGRCVPKEDKSLDDLYRTLQAAAARAGRVLPYAFEYRPGQYIPPSVRVSVQAAEAEPEHTGTAEAGPGNFLDDMTNLEAAIHGVANAPRHPRTTTAPSRVDADESEPNVAPVPTERGDRQHNASTSPHWPGVQVLRSHRRAGRMQDAFLLLWQIGTRQSPRDVAHAVRSCRRAGLSAEAEVIVRNASRRDAPSVLAVAAAFDPGADSEDLRDLLQFAAASS